MSTQSRFWGDRRQDCTLGLIPRTSRVECLCGRPLLERVDMYHDARVCEACGIVASYAIIHPDGRREIFAPLAADGIPASVLRRLRRGESDAAIMSATGQHMSRIRRWRQVLEAEPPEQSLPEWASPTCRRGHVYTLANTRVRPDGERECRACDALRHRGQRDGLVRRNRP